MLSAHQGLSLLQIELVCIWPECVCIVTYKAITPAVRHMALIARQLEGMKTRT